MSPYNIIIVDDDENLISGLRRTFKDKSDKWNIYYTKSAHDAIRMLSREKYDLIITDYKMPEMNGLELLAHVKENFPLMKRILLTGQSESEIFETSRDVAHLYLSKPLPAAEIFTSAEKILTAE